MAGVAHDAGFSDVTPSRVHRWVRERLLPSTGRQVAAGRAGFHTEPSAGAEAQLLALCAWRRHTKQLDALAVLLWMDDWVVPLARIRRSIGAYAPAMPSPPRTRTERAALEEQLEVLAYKFAPRMKARFGRRGVDREEIAEALLPMLRRIAGLPARIRKHDGAVIERLTGQDRARADTSHSVGPWLTTPAVEAVEIASALTFQAVSSLIEASDAELLQARPRLRFWIHNGPQIAEQVATRGDPEFAGFHLFGVLPPKAAVEALVQMLHFDRLGLGSSLDGLIAGFTVDGTGWSTATEDSADSDERAP